MKSTQLFMAIVLLTTPCILLYSSPHSDETRGTIKIDAKIFSIIDGTSLGNSSVHKAHVFSKRIEELLYGKKDKKSGALVGMLKFLNRPATIKEMVALEHKYGHIEEYQSHLHASFEEAVKIFEEMSDANLKEVRGTKDMTMSLIQKWSIQRNLPETPLLEWSKVEEGREQEHFHQTITTFAQFDCFLEDLKTFLKDFMHSCQKSLENYVAMLKSREKK